MHFFIYVAMFCNVSLCLFSIFWNPVDEGPSDEGPGAHKWVRSTFGRWDVEKVHAVVARSTFGSDLEVKLYKAPQLRSSFGRWHGEKMRAAVARSTFPRQNAQNTTCSDHLLTIRWHFDVEKSARCCGGKHIWKSKVSKTWILEPLCDASMASRCQPPQQQQQQQQQQQCEAYLEVKSVKHWGFRATVWCFHGESMSTTTTTTIATTRG